MKIIVIAPAGLQLSYLGCYGNLWIDTSCLDALAAEGIVFDQHISDAPSAKGAWRAWRTGRYSFPLSSNKDRDSFDVLATLRGCGIPSALITDSERTRPDDETGWEKIHAISGKKAASSRNRLWKSAAEAVRQLSSKDRALIWIETNMLIPPWSLEESDGENFSADADEESEEPIEPLLNPTPGLLHSADETTFLRLQRTYAAAVSQFDRQLGEFLQGSQQNDLCDSWMIIVTTDRGFPLGEHGLVGDSRPWLHEERVHIPLLIRLPSAAKGGARIGALTQPVDLMPTLLEGLGLTPVDCQGFSLLPLIRGEWERNREFACSGLEIGGEVENSLRTADWAFLVPQDTGSGGLRPPLRERQLYVKPEDRWEVNNVLQHHQEFAEQLEQALRAFVNAPFR
jgi:Sulfatase